MVIEMTTASIVGKTWDNVQSYVRLYAEKNNLQVSPAKYLQLEDAWGISLDLYKPEGMVSIASFSPYFCGDGKTLKQINVKFAKGQGIENILSNFE